MNSIAKVDPIEDSQIAAVPNQPGCLRDRLDMGVSTSAKKHGAARFPKNFSHQTAMNRSSHLESLIYQGSIFLRPPAQTRPKRLLPSGSDALSDGFTTSEMCLTEVTKTKTRVRVKDKSVGTYLSLIHI